MIVTRRASRGMAAVVGFGVVVLAACGSTQDETRHSADELQRGIDITVDGNSAAVDSAVVLLPDDLASYISLHPQLDDRGVAVLHPGEGGFDAVVVYRTGPYCGLLPRVLVDGDRTQLTIEVESRSSGDCDSMEYDEAIGLDLSPEYEQATIDANHNG